MTEAGGRIRRWTIAESAGTQSNRRTHNGFIEGRRDAGSPLAFNQEPVP